MILVSHYRDSTCEKEEKGKSCNASVELSPVNRLGINYERVIAIV